MKKISNSSISVPLAFLAMCLACLPVAAIGQPTVDLILVDGDAAEAGQEPGSFSITRDGSTAEALTVILAVSGSASIASDYSITNLTFWGAPNLYWINIPAGEATVSSTLTPFRDNEIEGPETAIFTLTADDAYVLGSQTEATISISDDVAEVTVALVDGNASEAGQDPGSFTVSRSPNGDTSQPITVILAVTGSATIGSDYTANLTFWGAPNLYWINIPGGELSVPVTLTPHRDNIIEGSETAIFTLQAGSAYTVGMAMEVTISIADDVAEVTLSLDDGEAAELGQNPASFTVNRSDNGETSQIMTVLLAVTGSATIGGDYVVNLSFWGAPNLYWINVPGAPQLSAGVTVTPVFDDSIEGDEEATFTLNPGSPNTYTIGMPDSVTISIRDHVEDIFEDGFEDL